MLASVLSTISVNSPASLMFRFNFQFAAVSSYFSTLSASAYRLGFRFKSQFQLTISSSYYRLGFGHNMLTSDWPSSHSGHFDFSPQLPPTRSALTSAWLHFAFSICAHYRVGQHHHELTSHRFQPQLPSLFGLCTHRHCEHFCIVTSSLRLHLIFNSSSPILQPSRFSASTLIQDSLNCLTSIITS